MNEDDWKNRSVEDRLAFLEGVMDAKSDAERLLETDAYMARLILGALAKTLVTQGVMDGAAFIAQLRLDTWPVIQGNPKQSQPLERAVDQLAAHLHPDDLSGPAKQ